MFIDAFVADKLTFNTFYEIYLDNYAFKQNAESFVAHQKELCSQQVEKHCPCLILEIFDGYSICSLKLYFRKNYHLINH